MLGADLGRPATVRRRRRLPQPRGLVRVRLSRGQLRQPVQRLHGQQGAVRPRQRLWPEREVRPAGPVRLPAALLLRHRGRQQVQE